jgi:glyoxylase-like metal-dependent hydrolase (beta-lactamase superfamily II)
MADTWRVTGVVDVRMRLRAERLYSNWDRPDAELPMTVGAFGLRGPGDRIVLVDAGAGESFTLPEALGTVESGGLLPDQLERSGIAPGDVDDVIFSHMHHDHVGWAALFPRATFWCHEQDWAACGGDRRVAAALETVCARIRWWSADLDLFPGLRLWHTPGHTPGSACVIVETAEGQTVLVGDVVHHPLEFAAALDGSGDVDTDRASAVRRAVALHVRAAGARIRGPHFPDLDLDVDIDSWNEHA